MIGPGEIFTLFFVTLGPEKVIGPGRQGIQLGSDEPARRIRVLFRFYGPEKSLFAKAWRLPDIEKI